jgi:hypothetical protein
MAHTHSVVDSDALFTIDPLTMQIIANGDIKALREGDHAAEIYSFSMPRYIEGHDMSLCNVVEVHYDNINVNSSTRTTTTNSSFDTVNNFGVSDTGEDMVEWTWLVKRDATQLPGSLNFDFRFACVAEDGTVEYEKFTEIFKSIPVNERIYNKEKIASNNVDVLERYRAELQEEVQRDIILMLAKTEMLNPIADENNALYTDENGAIYLL